MEAELQERKEAKENQTYCNQKAAEEEPGEVVQSNEAPL